MERLKILAAAASLHEFTVAQLAAYSGTSENTVRSVLRRDSNLFEDAGVADHTSSSRGGRRPRLQRVINEGIVFDEIRRLEEEVAGLSRKERGTPRAASFTRSVTESIYEKFDAIAVATRAVTRAWQSEDPETRIILSATAVRTLSHITEVGNSISGAPPDPLSYLVNAKLSSGSQSVQTEQAIRRVAEQLSALALLTADEARRNSLTIDSLTSASVACAELGHLFASSERRSMYLGVSRLARAARQLPPITLITSLGAQPSDFLKDAANMAWETLESDTGTCLWSQKWAQSWMRGRLNSCFVLYDSGHDSALIDNYLKSRSTFPSIVVSQQFDMTVVTKVAAAGAIYLPSTVGESDLAETIMNNPLLRDLDESEAPTASSSGNTNRRTGFYDEGDRAFEPAY